MNSERDYSWVLDIVRENYLVNGHAGVLASRPDFRKLLDHEQITVGRAAARTDPGIAIPSRRPSGVRVRRSRGVGTCGSLTGPHAPHAREPTLTNCSSREQRRIARS